MTHLIDFDGINAAAPRNARSLLQTLLPGGKFRIRTRGTQTIISIGADLIQAKAAIGHGNFGAWLATEFGWSERSAQNYMQAAKVFPKSATVAELPPTAVYRLAAPSTPPSVRERVISRLEAGERPSGAEIIDLVAEAPAKKKQREALKRKSERRRIASKQQELRQAEEQAAEARIAARIVDKNDDAVRELIDNLRKILWAHGLVERAIADKRGAQ
jgi:hypothetical protein